jgi:hypothetical protein
MKDDWINYTPSENSSKEKGWDDVLLPWALVLSLVLAWIVAFGLAAPLFYYTVQYFKWWFQ